MTSTTAVDRRPRFPLLKKSAAILFWIAVWEIVSLCVGQELLVPSPAQVLVRLLQLLRETDFWLISAASADHGRLSGSCGSGRFSGCADECIILSTCTG